jgi:CBS domain containing-hemolysin-like protein
MNDDCIPSILIIALLVLLSAYFSATETAFSSLNRTRLKTLAEQGNRRAALTLHLAEDYDRLLSTILVGNNVVNIAMSSISTLLFVRLLPNIGATVSTIVITLVVLIFGEVSPKSLAKENPEKFAMSVASTIRVLVWLLTPINFLFTQWKKLLGKLFRSENRRHMTQDELLMLVEEVAQDGTIDEDEGDLLRSAIEFNDLDAEDILTHRVDLEAISVHATPEEVARVFSESRYSRLPVYDGSIDNIVGVLHQKDFYTGTGISRRPLTEIMQEPVYVPQSVPIGDLLKVLQKHKAHMAVVSDEYGGTLGIVTMEDILEELVGEIWDEHDEVVESFRKVGEHTYRVLGTAEVEQLDRFFQLDCDSDCTSVSGWVMEQLGRIPDEGDAFDYQDLHITVTETDSHRVEEIEITRKQADAKDVSGDAGREQNES